MTQMSYDALMLHNEVLRRDYIATNGLPLPRYYRISLGEAGYDLRRRPLVKVTVSLEGSAEDQASEYCRDEPLWIEDTVADIITMIEWRNDELWDAEAVTELQRREEQNDIALLRELGKSLRTL